MRTKTLIAIVISLCFLSAGFALGGDVSDQLRDSVDRIVSILKNPELRVEEKTLERRNMIFKIVEDRFDFTEMAKRSVGEFWYQMSETQQKEFEATFSGLLEKTYITKIEKYTDERIVFGTEKQKDGDLYSVPSTIISGNKSIPVIYSIHKVDGQWLVYDVNIEGASLVTNYLTQFREAVRKGGFNGLMVKVEEKQKKRDED